MTNDILNELIQKKAQIESDKSLSADERKKQLRRLRKQIRSHRDPGYIKEKKAKAKASQGSVIERKKRVLSSLSQIEFIERFSQLTVEKGMTHFNPKVERGYHYSVALSCEAGIAPEELLTKFKARWGHEATTYTIMPLRPDETLVGLGPIGPIIAT